jgi:hypothetical protein
VRVRMSQEQDSLTFDKVVGSSRPTFVRFDQEYPVGQRSMARARNAAVRGGAEIGTRVRTTPLLSFLPPREHPLRI